MTHHLHLCQSTLRTICEERTLWWDTRKSEFTTRTEKWKMLSHTFLCLPVKWMNEHSVREELYLLACEVNSCVCSEAVSSGSWEWRHENGNAHLCDAAPPPHRSCSLWARWANPLLSTRIIRVGVVSKNKRLVLSFVLYCSKYNILFYYFTNFWRNTE